MGRIDDILHVGVNRSPVSRTATVTAGLSVFVLGTGIAGASFASAPPVPQSRDDVWALGQNSSPAAFQTLVGQLGAPDPGFRAVAALSLGETGDHRAVEHLVTALADSDLRVRENAAIALTKHGGAELAMHVVPLTQDPVPDVRSVARWVLGELGGAESARELIRVIKEDPDHHTRTMAAMAVVQIPDVDVVPGLLSLLTKVDDMTRRDVIVALGLTGDSRAVPALTSIMTGDPDENIRRIAMHAFADLEQPVRVAAWLAAMEDRHWRVRNQALLRLALEDHDAAHEALLKALDDPQHQVRLNAAWALEERGR